MFGERWGIPASFAADGTRPMLGEFEQLVAYRVVQEALSNVARHAQASHVKVTVMGCNGPQVKVTVADDGNGIDPARRNTDRSGLAGMRERALLAHAQIDVRDTAGGGTTIELTLPSRSQRLAA